MKLAVSGQKANHSCRMTLFYDQAKKKREKRYQSRVRASNGLNVNLAIKEKLINVFIMEIQFNYISNK